MHPLRALIVAVAMSGTALAQSSPQPSQSSRARQVEELKQLTIEELAETDVTTPGRRIERLADVAAAVTVISGDDLRRMGVVTLAQALRLAGHLDVVQISGPQFALSARGFTISTSNKMLVLIDGRTVYSPVFAGVFWEMQDVIIPDIERIEVTRGPGGSVWGANAVNGVINIITKRAAETRGTFVNLAAGSSVLGPLAARYGGRLGAAGSYRVYGKWRSEDSHQLVSGADAKDDFDFGQGGFRIESSSDGASYAFLQGDVFRGTLGTLSETEINLSGGNLLGRYTRRYGSHASTLQAYFDHTFRRVPNQYRGVLNTIDLDAQHEWRLGRQNLVFGAGYRHYDGDDLGDGPGFFFDPRERASHRVNVYAQDEIRVAPGVFLTAGSKFERNEFSGWEIQPTLRGRWSGDRRSVWAAVSRAVRVPTRFDTDLRIRIPNTSTIFLTGSTDFKPETVIAYEAGYRRQFADRLSLDLAAYVNRYDDLRTQEPGLPVVLANGMNAVSRGVEASTSIQLTHWWQTHVAYTYLWKELTFDATSHDPTRGVSEANDPKHIFKVRSYMNPVKSLEIDTFLRYHGARPAPPVADYTDLDARIGYRIRPWWDVSLIGSSLLHERHVEFIAGTAPETYQRAWRIRSLWRF